MSRSYYIALLLTTMLLVLVSVDAQRYKSTTKEHTTRGRFKPSVHLPKTPSVKYSKEKAEDDDYRLPTSLRPYYQLIKVKPNIGDDWVNHGFVRIDFECVNSTDVIEFHMLDIVTLNDTIRLIDFANNSVNLTFLSHEYDVAKQVYRGRLESPLIPGHSYRFDMDYQGLVSDGLDGLYRSFYEGENGEDVYLAATQFESMYARMAFPCFDEPAFKVAFDIQIQRDPTRNSISNMPSYDSYEDPATGYYWDLFNTTLPMSTYLVAFVISDFAHIERTTNDESTLFRIYAKDSSIPEADYALQHGPDILSFYEDYYGIEFPLPKQDMIALPDSSAGGMENWGLVTYSESSLLYNPEESGAIDKQYNDIIMAHELAHQWFGDLVTLQWWSDVWLNEGFAAYMQYLGTDAVSKEYDYFNFFGLYQVQPAFDVDSLESSHPIYMEGVSTVDEVEALFDTITYEKGSSIIRMMRFFLTEDTFRQALYNYLMEHSYGNARTEDLWEAMTEQAYDDGTLLPWLTVGQIMDTWTLQEGYPVVDVILHGNGSATVTQSRFLQVNNPDAPDFMWWIPLTWTSSENPIFGRQGVYAWMPDTYKILSIVGLPEDATWILFNVDQTGFYRVNYDTANWKALSDQLWQDHTVFSNLTRCQLIEDIMSLAKAFPPKVTYPLAMDLIRYAKREADYVPMQTALNKLTYLEEMFTNFPGYSNLRHFILDLIEPLSSSVGFIDNIKDPHLEQLTRSTLVDWNCHLEQEDCVQYSTELFSLWMASPEANPISPNLRASVYCAAIANGGDEEWNFAYEQFVKSNNAVAKSNLIHALGCSKRQDILSTYLYHCYFDPDSPFKKQDSYSVFYSIAKNDCGNQLAADYLNLNWYALHDYYGSFYDLAVLETYVAEEYNTDNDLKKLEEFKVAHSEDLGTAISVIDGSIRQTKRNIQWTVGNYDTILQWLIDNGF